MLVGQIVQEIEEREGTTTLQWVKAHAGIAGNEMANQAVGATLTKLSQPPPDGYSEFTILIGSN